MSEIQKVAKKTKKSRRVAEEPVAEKAEEVLEPNTEEPKAEDVIMEEPITIEQTKEEEPKEQAKAEETKEVKEEKKEVEPEKPKDVEADAPEDHRARISHAVAMNGNDALVNTLVSDDTILVGLSLGSLQGLYSAVRANTGIKSGRYYYEAKVVEQREKLMNLKFGFSTAKASLLGGEGSFLFASTEGNFVNGTAKSVHLTGTKSNSCNDIIGVLLNRVEGSEQCNTVSVFLNGVRRCAPQKIEVASGEALFPHVMFKGCSVNLNFSPKQIMPPQAFKVRSLQDASADDVILSVMKPLQSEPEVVFPIGFKCTEWIEEFTKNNPTHIALTTDAMKVWFEKSGVATRFLADQGKSIGQLGRARNYIVALNKDNFNGCIEKERKQMCARFSGYKKIAKVMLSPPDESTHYPLFNEVTLPTYEEGFDQIDFIVPKEEAEPKLEEWKAQCQLRTLVTDLKIGTLFKDKTAEFRNFMEEKKKDAEAFKDFKPENYMLALLRAEIHYVLHGFLEDVKDEARKGFCEEHFGHYYKKYRGVDFNAKRFGLNTVKDLCAEYADDTVEFSSLGLMLPKLAKDIDQIEFLNMEERQRESRKNREDAGDEMAKLKFSAQLQRAVIPAPTKSFNQVQIPALGPNAMNNRARIAQMNAPRVVAANLPVRRPAPIGGRVPNMMVQQPQFTNQKRPQPGPWGNQDPKRMRR